MNLTSFVIDKSNELTSFCIFVKRLNMHGILNFAMTNEGNLSCAWTKSLNEGYSQPVIRSSFAADHNAIPNRYLISQRFRVMNH